MKDYYVILGIQKSATDDEIKKAYRKLAHQYHPDKPGGSKEKMQEINEAYGVLSDKTKKWEHDLRYGHGVPNVASTPNKHYQQWYPMEKNARDRIKDFDEQLRKMRDFYNQTNGKIRK